MYEELPIRELDLSLISPSAVDSKNASKIVVIGKPGTGKTTLITSLIYNKSKIIPIGMICSGTEDSTPHYRKIFPSVFVYNGLNTDKINDFIKRQKIAKQNLPNPWGLLLLDDCTDDPSILSTPLFKGMYKNGRHWKMLFILSLQYALDIKPDIRTNIDGVFILKEANRSNRKKLWEHYAGVIPDFEMFNTLMDQLTENYTALYIHNSGQSNRWEDNVFWYKAGHVPDDFRFGCRDFWEFHEQRYDSDYRDPF